MTRGGSPKGGSVLVHRLVDGGADVEVERLADGARLLGPVEHGDRAHARGQGGDQLLSGEGPVEADRQHPDPLAVADEGVDRLAGRADSRAHEHDDALGVGGARGTRPGRSGARSVAARASIVAWTMPGTAR